MKAPAPYPGLFVFFPWPTVKRQFLALTTLFGLALLLGLVLALSVQWLRMPPSASPTALSLPDSTPGPSLAFEGMVHVAGSGAPALWVIGNYPVTVISSTTIISNGLPLQPGVWARVEAVKLAALQATSLELLAVPTSDLYDLIEGIDQAQGIWQVGNTRVAVGPATVVMGSSPSVGQMALVHGQRSDSGIDAQRILVVATDSEVTYQGAVSAVGQNWLRIDDVTIEIVPSTVFSGAVPSLGSDVQARGLEVGSSRMRATHIWTLEQGDPQVRFFGWLQRIDGPGYPYLWRVNLVDGPRLRPVFVAVQADTLVDETAGPAAPGAWLAGEATYQGNNLYRARTISVLPRAPKQEIVGQIAALPADPRAGIWQVGEYRVQVSSATGIVGVPAVGAMVWVSGAPDYANVIQAQLVEVLGN